MADEARLATALADRYRLDRELGRGGMATVHLAHDLRHDREVAVKVLRPELSALLGRDRFLAEIRLTAKLDHPHILTLIDSGESDGFLWYVLPFVRGESLRARLDRDRQLGVDEAVEVTRDIARALDYAHQRGVLHRDVKPENILFQEGEAMLADFGIALALREAGGNRLTETGLSLGTPTYMSPEQATGERQLDARSDVYSLGAVLYEMLTGEPPHRGATAQATIAKLMTEPPTPLRVVRPSVPEHVARAVDRALAKVPADRPASAAAFAAMLEGTGTAAPAAAPTVPVATAPARRSGARIAAVVAGVAVVAAALALLLRPRGGSASLSLGQSVPVSNDAGLEIDAALSPDGKLIAYAAGPPVGTRIFVRQVENGRPVAIGDSLETDQRFPRWAPDGSRLLYVVGSKILVVPALGGAARVAVRAPDWVTGADWSPDGREIAFTAADSLFTVAAEGGVPRALTRALEAHAAAWSPDGRFIAYVTPNSFYVGSHNYGNRAVSALMLAPRGGGAPIAVTDSAALVASPAWLPDGRGLLYVSDREGQRDVYLRHVTSDGQPEGAPERLTTGLRLHSLALSRDGRRLAYNIHTAVANIWSLPHPGTGVARASGARPLTRGNQVVEYLSLSPDGRWVYFDSDRSGRAEIYRIPAAGGEQEQLTDAPGGNYLAEASPDGRLLAFQSQRQGSRDVFVMPADGGPATPVRVAPGNDNHPSWSADGRRLYFDHDGGDLPSGLYVTERRGAAWSSPQRVEGVQLEGFLGIARASPVAQAVFSMVRDTLRLHPGDGQPARVVRTRDDATVPTMWFAQSSAAGQRLMFQSVQRGTTPRFGIWEMSPEGGEPREIVQFDDPYRAGLWGGMDTDGKTLYFTINEWESDVWVTDVREE